MHPTIEKSIYSQLIGLEFKKIGIFDKFEEKII